MLTAAEIQRRLDAEIAAGAWLNVFAIVSPRGNVTSRTHAATRYGAPAQAAPSSEWSAWLERLSDGAFGPAYAAHMASIRAEVAANKAAQDAKTNHVLAISGPRWRAPDGTIHPHALAFAEALRRDGWAPFRRKGGAAGFVRGDMTLQPKRTRHLNAAIRIVWPA